MINSCLLQKRLIRKKNCILRQTMIERTEENAILKAEPRGLIDSEYVNEVTRGRMHNEIPS